MPTPAWIWKRLRDFCLAWQVSTWQLGLKIRAIDPFCGAGGSSWRAQAAGAKVVAGFDRMSFDYGTRRDRIKMLGNAVCLPVMREVVRNPISTAAKGPTKQNAGGSN